MLPVAREGIAQCAERVRAATGVSGHIPSPLHITIASPFSLVKGHGENELREVVRQWACEVPERGFTHEGYRILQARKGIVIALTLLPSPPMISWYTQFQTALSTLTIPSYRSNIPPEERIFHITLSMDVPSTISGVIAQHLEAMGWSIPLPLGRRISRTGALLHPPLSALWADPLPVVPTGLSLVRNRAFLCGITIPGREWLSRGEAFCRSSPMVT